VPATPVDDKLDALPLESASTEHRRQEESQVPQHENEQQKLPDGGSQSTLPHPILPPSEDSSQTNALLKAKYVIVGGGTAAYAAMKAIQERERDADILMISAETHVPYMRPPLSKELWHSKDAETLKFRDWGGTEREYVFNFILLLLLLIT
jgi:hypothetical protein